jgi:hypothetical protein
VTHWQSRIVNNKAFKCSQTNKIKILDNFYNLEVLNSVRGYLYAIEKDTIRQRRAEPDCGRSTAPTGTAGEDLSGASAQNVSLGLCTMRA